MPGSRRWLPVAAAMAIAGWGANQFTPLAVVYRAQETWPDLELAAMFTVYLVGLVPGLLMAGPAANRYGRRRVVRSALVLAAAASAVLAAGAGSEYAVFLSRLAAGLAAGAVHSAGTTWLHELAPYDGRRLPMYATGSGLAAGALTAGVLAEWFPLPLVVPCVVHCTLALAVLVATWRVPETLPLHGRTWLRPRSAGLRRAAVGNPRFLRVVLPASPAVFAASTVAYVVLPPLVEDQVPGYAPLFSGLVTALTITMGLVVQPLAAWLDHTSSARSTLTAMATVIVGLLVGAVAVYEDSVWLVLAAAAVLGAGYGLTLASGLLELERLTPPSALPSAASLYHGATYSGFLTPLLLAVTAGAAPYPVLLVGLAVVGLLFLLLTARHSRLHLV